MTIAEIAGLAFVLFNFGLIIIFLFTSRDRQSRPLREIPAFTKLRRTLGEAVETGKRIHLSLGRGNITGLESAVGFAGLNVLARIGQATSTSDRPPVATSGSGSLAILSQDTLASVSRDMHTEFEPYSGQVSGLTPFSYAAGTLAFIHDEEVGANVLIGNFGSEVALITEAAERSGSPSLAGTDNLLGQAVLYAVANETLIGEETFAGGAYLEAGAAHTASLRAQDLLRWGLITIILLGALLKLAGML